MKWKLIMLMVLLIVPIAFATLKDCVGPTMSPGQLPCLIISSWQFPNACNTYTIKIYDSNATLLDTRTMGNYGDVRCNITFNHTKLDSYLMNWSSGDSSKLIIQSDDKMASLSVTIFIGAITLALFYMGIKHNFSKNPVANLIFKRCLILLGMFLLSLDTTIIVTMADNAGLGVNQELFRYLYLINWSIYLFMLFLAWTTLTNSLKLWAKLGRQKRMGEGEENEYD